jgi:secondary thiamine-phosphate synthase enzyme
VIFRSEHKVRTQGDGDLIDLSEATSAFVRSSGLTTGLCNLFVGGSTAALTTIEFEPGLKQDFPRLLQKLAPREGEYEHNKTWGDGNGFSHVRASLIGPDLTVPIRDGRLVLGTWQQPVLVDFDNRPRQRTIYLTAVGE